MDFWIGMLVGIFATLLLIAWARGGFKGLVSREKIGKDKKGKDPKRREY